MFHRLLRVRVRERSASIVAHVVRDAPRGVAQIDRNILRHVIGELTVSLYCILIRPHPALPSFFVWVSLTRRRLSLAGDHAGRRRGDGAGGAGGAGAGAHHAFERLRRRD